MSASSIQKPSPHRSDNKSPSVAIKSRQQAAHDSNKRRTLLQDNSWIKKRPEEESADENYGRAVLNQYKSQDSLNRSSPNEKEDEKAVLGRYRSDTTLDRIPARSDTDKTNKSPNLNNKQSDRQSLTPNPSPSNTAATSPIKKKRQSWMPPPVSGSTTTTETTGTKQTTSENSEGPTMAALSSEQVTPQKSKADVEEKTTARTPQKSKADMEEKATARTPQKSKADVEEKATARTPQKSKADVEEKATARTPQKSKTDVEGKATARNQDLDNLAKVNPSSFSSDKERKDLEDVTETNTTGQKNKRDKDLGDHTKVKPGNDQSKKRVTEQVHENPPKTPNNLPETNYYSDSERKTSKSSYGAYEDNITGNTIKTVYSTSDRSIIGKDICTYCRKPLGFDAKMILDALQICCHSTCFKCEVCKRPLEDLKAGDSIWIYRQTVHCEPCYSKIKEKWIY
ncbi:sciellin [Calypte anna]|uniref:sciellin n=1 Tax=Calypte anna TaxID=9244 RepID=UPI0011C4935A|nr:sciellin [Calypte anna]